MRWSDIELAIANRALDRCLSVCQLVFFSERCFVYGEHTHTHTHRDTHRESSVELIGQLGFRSSEHEDDDDAPHSSSQRSSAVTAAVHLVRHPLHVDVLYAQTPFVRFVVDVLYTTSCTTSVTHDILRYINILTYLYLLSSVSQSLFDDRNLIQIYAIAVDERI